MITNNTKRIAICKNFNKKSNAKTAITRAIKPIVNLTKKGAVIAITL